MDKEKIGKLLLQIENTLEDGFLTEYDKQRDVENYVYELVELLDVRKEYDDAYWEHIRNCVR